MKGFKKDGKFRPTGNKTKSSLKKTDVKRKVSTTSGRLRKKESVGEGLTDADIYETQDAFEVHVGASAKVLIDKGMNIEGTKQILHESVDDVIDQVDKNGGWIPDSTKWEGKLGNKNDEMKTKNPNPTKQFNTTEMTDFLGDFLDGDVVSGTMSEFYRDDELEALEEREDEAGQKEYERKYEEQGLWASGEGNSEMPNGDTAFSYYGYEDEGGVHPAMVKILNDHGWWFEWNDAGTIMLYQNN